MTKFKDFCFCLIIMSLRRAFNLHEAAPDHRHGPADVLEYAYRLDALVAVVTDEVCPDDCDAHHGQQQSYWMRAKFIESQKCSCIIGRSLVILPSFLELVLFLYKVTNSKDLYNNQPLDNQLINVNIFNILSCTKVLHTKRFSVKSV